MLVRAKCMKTGDQGQVDIGTLTREQVEERRQAGGRFGYHCGLGHHVEIEGNVLSCLELDWSSAEEGTAPSHDTIVQDLKNRYEIVGSFDEIVGMGVTITGFSYGYCHAHRGDHEFTLDYTQTPEGRVYYGVPKHTSTSTLETK